MRALVTGANGALGPSLIKHLLVNGWAVNALVRQPNSNTFTGLPVKVFVGDVTSPNGLSNAFKEVEVVFHLAALLHVMNSPKDLTESYHLTNVIGTENVVSTALQEDVKRVILFSTIAVYGNQQQSVITENTTPQPESFYARTKLEAEQIVLSARKDDGTSLGTVMRLGAAYGPRMKGNYMRLLRSLNKGCFIPIGPGVNRRTLVFEKDIAQAAFIAANHPDAPGSIYNVTDGCFHTIDEIIAAICNAVDRPAPRLRIPEAPARWIAGIFEDLLRIFEKKSPISRAIIDKYKEDIAVDGSLIQEELGFSPCYDLTRGWQETVKVMKRSGSL